MKIFISPVAETDWTVDAGELVAEIKSRFPEAIVTERTTGAHSLEWKLADSVEGSLDLSGNTVVLDGNILDCARFAVWYRRLVPVSQLLVFYDESYSADLELELATTVEELITPFVIDDISNEEKKESGT